MSDWHAEVVRITEIHPHENADRLEVAIVYGTTPVVIVKGQYQVGDLVSYIPIDSVIPEREEFSFLQASDRRRLKAKRLRGVFSMGLLVAAPDDAAEGHSVVDHFGLTKYEPPEPGQRHGFAGGRGECLPGPSSFPFPKFTDIESHRRHASALAEGEAVVCREKLHGANARYVYGEGQLWVGSRTVIKKTDGTSVWSEVARRHGLAEKLAAMPLLAIYGEVYGVDQNGSRIQDLTYGATEPQFALFDAFDAAEGRWLDATDLPALAASLGVSMPTVLYEGPWSEAALEHAEGPTTYGGKHVREGFVVRPMKERFHLRLPDNRVMLKVVGQGYMLRKDAA